MRQNEIFLGDCRPLRYLSVCSGIEAATCAWHGLGWQPWAFSEIERFPSAVLAHHYPHVPNLGDMTKFKDWPDATIDLLVGGTPCQSFSVAGLRKGLADPRGNLMLGFGALADRLRPRWLVWENVPGVLSSNGGRDFGAFLGMLGILGYGFAYRVLDAQYFGVPQRRRRVFVVGHLGDWRRAAAVLFERHSLQGHPPPRREARKATTGGAGVGAGGGRFASTGDISHCLNAGGIGRQDYETDTLIAHSLRGEGFDASEDGTGRGTPLVPVAIGVDAYNGALTGGVAATMGTRGSAETASGPQVLVPVAFALRGRDDGAQPEVHGDGDTAGSLRACNGGSSRDYVAFSCKDHGADAGELAPTLRAMGHGASHANAGGQVAVAFDACGSTLDAGDVFPTLRKREGGASGHGAAVAASSAVRRLTPRECERLQGFPDDYTRIPLPTKARKQRKRETSAAYAEYLRRREERHAADGPRYKALGNSMAVPVMRWIGERIQLVEAITSIQEAAA